MLLLKEYIRKFLNEIDLGTIQNALVANKKLPFENIFKGKLRIVIPLEDESFSLLKQIMEEEGYEVDIANKKAYITKTSRDGKQNKVELRLGKAVSNLIKMKEKNGEDNNLENLKKLYAKYSSVGSSYSIVLTRAPIDVLRMSDFRGLESCHSKGSSYWQCAIQEAQSGGAIAYLVSSKDIEGIDLQQDEVFTDKDRGLNGIAPIGRLRIRNFEYPNGNLAIPESTIYGQDIGNFESSVVDFLRDSQSEAIENDLPEPYDMVLKGGGYSDTASSTLLNSFFDTDFYKGEDIENENNEGSLFEQFEEEANEMWHNASSKIRNLSVTWEVVDNDDDAFVQWKAEIELQYPELKITNAYGHNVVYDYNISKKNLFIISNKMNNVLNVRGWRFDAYEANQLNNGYWVFRLDPMEDSTGHPDEFNAFLQDCIKFEREFIRIKEVWDRFYIETAEKRYNEIMEEK